MNDTEHLIAIINNRCNSRCRFCTYWKNTDTHILPLKYLIRAINQLKQHGLRSVMISGGEPTLVDDYEKYIEAAQERGLHVKLATNGINPLRGTKADHTIISLDSYKRETYAYLRGVDAFDTVLNNAKSLDSFSLSFLVQKSNFMELPQFFKLAKKIGAKSVSLLTLNESGDFNRKDRSSYETFDAEDIKKLREILAIDPKIKLNHKEPMVIADYYEHLISERRPLRYRRCPMILKNVTIDFRGRVFPCPFIDDSFPTDKGLIDMQKIASYRKRYLEERDIFDKNCRFCLESRL